MPIKHGGDRVTEEQRHHHPSLCSSPGWLMSLPAPSIACVRRGAGRRSQRTEADLTAELGASAGFFDFSEPCSSFVCSRRTADAREPPKASPCSPINDLSPN